ncbi:MAG: YciI family protein [Alphaproteobacteria bacterium]|nr:YciI family protein [Alphaproteobacteria bacterium]
MPRFLFVYHGGKMPDTPEEGQKVMAAWKSWLEGLGDAALDPGAPVGMSKTVFSDKVDDNGGANPTSGYSIIKATDMEDAIAKSKGCPQTGNGSIEIAEIIELDM